MGVGESPFFVSHISPHKVLSPSTVSRWLGQVFSIVGIYTEIFKAQSIWWASSSKTEVTGISQTDIIKQGQWSQASTFQKMLTKNIKENDFNFKSKIFNKQLSERKSE